ncbi:nucleoid-associated protein [Desulfosporosinus youngiae]|uniref:Nucleoid-associated protein n=1 Tax=Desulfosporosinus youngiae DSM 17734 TaxID=768710 RepID=H5XZR9_9FIRM|nr:nucleoid-associated protein [Desulfosporosinus youngiae]EHQ92115.1 nucleoid-associated protein [Desulfosporosinus youngiae DSM 17734]
MITIINKAILHILDFKSGIMVFSDQELDIGSKSVLTFLTKHIEKIMNDSGSKSGNFNADSSYKKKLTEYVTDNIDFTSFSVHTAELVYSAISLSDILEPADLIVCDVNIDDKRFIAILKCNNKVGFTHQVIKNEGKIQNGIINHYAILPNISQKIDEYAIIEVSSLDIRFCDKKRFIDGKDTYILSDIVLGCNSTISPKNAIDLLHSITRMVSENHGQSSVAAISKVKNYLVENAEVSEYLDTTELGKEVFNSSPIMQEEYIKEVKNTGIPETVKVDRSFAIKKGKNHRIKTDTGIEITFPADYFHNKDYIEFINNPDGTLSIEMKNIGKIINK